jgi:putative membrane protein
MFLLFKSLHLISMVAWFAGLFYMFRLFVYHVENKNKQDVVDILKVMSYKLYYYITFPAMITTFIFGGLLLSNSAYNIAMQWFFIKSFLLICLVIYHFYIGHTLKRFNAGNYFLTSKQCRMLNEVPTLFLISIIFVAVFRASINF